MSYSIQTTPDFDKEFKKLFKKYKSLKKDLASFIQSLESNPIQGTNLGNNCYKIRLPIKSKNKGKSAGARIITNIIITDKIVYLLTIYDKSDKDSISDSELLYLLENLK